MATRNFYEQQSVAAFFLYSVQTGDSTGATAAAAELVQSGLEGLVSRVATLALLLAPPRYGFLAVETRLAAALSLPPFPLPTPLPRLPPPTTTSKKACAWKPVKTAKAATLWWAIQDALNHGRVERAAAISLGVAAEDRASLFESFGLDARWLSLCPFPLCPFPLCPFPLERVFVHAYAKTSTGGPPPARPLESRGRAFSVSPVALATWAVASPPLPLCMGVPVWTTEADASPFWKRLAERCGVRPGLLEGRDDGATEAFYTEGFPIDIPDEWSMAERAKSHGLATASSCAPSVWAPSFRIAIQEI
jgi:hypothetical protein